VKKILSFLFFLIFNFISGQINLPVSDSVTNFLFAKSEDDKINLITKNGIFELNNQSWDYYKFPTKSFKKEIGKIGVEFSHKEYLSIQNSKDQFIVSIGGGPVFRRVKNEYIRMDNTYLHRNQVWGSFFIYNDKIHIYGGYGFWSFKDYITFYDSSIKQWDIVYNESEYIPKGRGKAISFVSNDSKLFIIGGTTISKNALYNTDNDDVFYFDLIEKKFVHIGKLASSLVSKHTLFKLPSINDNAFLIEKDSIVKFDFNRMSFTSYKKNNLNINIDNKFPTYIIDENLYFMSVENQKNTLESINLNSLDSSDFILSTLPIIEQKKDRSYEIILVSVLGFLFFWIILKLFLYKDHIKGLLLFDDKIIFFKNRSIKATSTEINFISDLSNNNFISASQINKIISSKKYSKSHLTSVRNNFINEINSKLYHLTGEKQSIIETKNPYDNRIKVYKTNINNFKPKTSFIKFLFKF